MQELITYKNDKSSGATYRTLSDIFNSIKLGTFQSLVNNYRSTGDKNYKLSLPVFTLGLYKEGSTASFEDIISHNGMMSFDVDDLTEKELKETRQKIISALGEKLVAVFISPSGRGLKYIIHTNYTDCNRDIYKHIYAELKKRMLQAGLAPRLDKTCDITRPIFVSWDHTSIYNEKHEIIDVTPLVKTYRPKSTIHVGETNMSDTGKDEFKRKMRLYLNKISKWGRYNFMFNLMCALRSCGGNKADAIKTARYCRVKGLVPRKLQVESKLLDWLDGAWETIMEDTNLNPLNVFVKMDDEELKQYKKEKISSILVDSARRMNSRLA